MELLTTNELSKLLKVSHTTIYRWARNKRVPFIRMNGSFRFSSDDINHFIQINKDKVKKASETLVN